MSRFTEADLDVMRANLSRDRAQPPVVHPGGPVSFVVHGVPVPQGSMRSPAPGVVISDNPKLAAWRKAVAMVAVQYRRVPLWTCPVRASILFRLPRPKSAPKARVWPVVKPDGDKLQRAIFDALTGIIYVDDAQVVQAEWTKAYGEPCAIITLAPVIDH